MTYCYVCYDTGEIECPTCHGKGRRGGILGFGAKVCPHCSGTGKILCEECDETRDYLLAPDQEPPLVQLDLGLAHPNRPAIAPLAPPFQIGHVDWEAIDDSTSNHGPGRGSR